MSPLARQIEALLFLAPEPVPIDELADALQAGEEAVRDGLAELDEALDGRGVVLREVAGGWALTSHPDAEEAARRLLARPRTPALTPPRPRRWRSSATCSPSRGPKSPASAAWRPSRRPTP